LSKTNFPNQKERKMETLEDKKEKAKLLKEELKTLQKEIKMELQNNCEHLWGAVKYHHHNSDEYRTCSLCEKTEWYNYLGGYWPSEKINK